MGAGGRESRAEMGKKTVFTNGPRLMDIQMEKNIYPYLLTIDGGKESMNSSIQGMQSNLRPAPPRKKFPGPVNVPDI